MTVTPYEIWHAKKPDVSYLRVFGTKAFAHVPDVKGASSNQKNLKVSSSATANRPRLTSFIFQKKEEI